MKVYPSVFGSFSLSILAACHGPDIRIGMSGEEVVRIMGPPVAYGREGPAMSDNEYSHAWLSYPHRAVSYHFNADAKVITITR